MATEDSNTQMTDPPTKQLTRYGRELATLLWQKAIADSTPETRQALFTWKRLMGMAESMLPESEVSPKFRNITHDSGLRQVQAAEYILTSATPDIFAQSCTY